ncbi:metal-dependent hydrolase [bacterium]|nr:metal-dependent hydrolase [bacterium]
MDIKYLGHSAFEFGHDGKKILIDPNITSTIYNWHDENITNIFLTHAHSDHIGQAIEIAKEKGATITAIAELASYCKEQGVENVESVNLGGTLKYDWGSAIFLPAFHSSSLPDGRYGGCAASILFNIDNTRIYHAGDTCLHEGMKTVKELYRPQIAMLPIGGRYTMDAEHAAIAAQWIGAQRVIPMHYDTFPEIKAEVQQFAQIMQANTQMIVALDPNKQS